MRGREVKLEGKCRQGLFSIKSSPIWKPSKEVGVDEENLKPEEVIKLKELVDKYCDVFSKDDSDIGKARFEHDIKLMDSSPIKSRAYRVPHSQKEIIEKQIKNMLEMGIISKADSSCQFTSPIVLVKKKEQGEYRFCVDFRKLNALTIKDNYQCL